MEIDVTPDTNLEKSENVQKSGDETEETKINSNTGGISVNDETSDNKQCVKNTTNSHSKKVIKHALRQQAKRRRKNTTIASGNTTSVPRIIVKPLPPQPVEETPPVPVQKTPTMREVLASIPGFSIKPRKRSNKKLSTAAQLEQTKEGCIDLETPDSILVNTNLRALLNKYTFASLPSLYQNKLVQLLPTVDRQIITNAPDSPMRLSTSGLNNEFFARACLEWQERLGEGEFTPENQQKLKTEADKERSRLDPWKLKHFEPIWGDRSQADCDNTNSNNVATLNPPRPPIRTTIKLRPTTSVSNKNKPTPQVKRLRTVGAMTRSCYKESELANQIELTTRTPIPDLLPIKTHRSHKHESSSSSQLSIKKFESVSDKVEIPPETKNDNNTSENHPEISVINISDTIMKNDEETIISCKDNILVNSDKRKRSLSTEIEQRSPKRKTPSPVQIDVNENPTVPTDEINRNDENEEKDNDNVIFEEKTNEIVNEPVLTDSIEKDNEISEETSELPAEQTSETEDTTSITAETTSCITSEEEDQENKFNEVCELIKDQKYESNLQDETSESSDKIETSETNEPKTCEYQVEEQPLEDIKNDSRNETTYQEQVEMEQQLPIENIQQLTDSFQILPNTLILQQESIVLEKSCPENCDNETCVEAAENLEASVEESDLVISQITETNFERVRNISDEDEANEDRFIDAENYVLESGQISLSTSQKTEKNGGEEDIQVALFAAAVSRGEDCCWDVVDSSTEKLLEVPLHALDSVPVGMVGSGNANDHVEVIPMQEELEVRLEEGTFPVPNDWPYDVKIDSDMVAAALGSTERETNPPENTKQVQSYPEFSGNQVKLELEVTLTPEIVSSDSLITSTVGTSNNGANSTVTPAVSKTVTTVIPPTTIVCLPSVVSTASMLNQSVNLVTQCTTLPRPGMVQSSSALPYLALSTSQPIRAVPAHSKTKPKNSQSNTSNRNRGSSKPPPGAVNLERSYQICQAVIQNSPNRDQLRCQLKPPPSLLAAATANSSTKKTENNRQTQYGAVTSSRGSNKTFTPPLPASGNFQGMAPGSNGVKTITQKARTVPYQQQRQPSPPVVVRHVFTSGQGIPVTMAVLPQAQALSPEVVEGQGQMGHVGQYILVQRAGISDHHNVPRSSSAPPSQQQIGSTINSGGASQLVSIGGRGRPASVDIEHPPVQGTSCNDFIVQCPNPGIQAVTRRQRLSQGVVYGDVSVENQLQNYTIIGDNIMMDHPAAAMQSQMVLQQKVRSNNSNIPASDPTCPCSLKAMVVCKKCGAFCHDDCIGPNKLCRTCLIR